MRNLHELFEEVCEALYELGIDPQDLVIGESDACQAAAAIRVYGAYQPRYPLAGNLQSLSVLHHEDADDKVVWLSVGYAPSDMNPYAPHELFEAY